MFDLKRLGFEAPVLRIPPTPHPVSKPACPFLGQMGNESLSNKSFEQRRSFTWKLLEHCEPMTSRVFWCLCVCFPHARFQTQLTTSLMFPLALLPPPPPL